MRSRAVLVVDDEPTMRFCLERLLRAEGFDVATAVDVRGAFGAVAERTPDAMVLDTALDGGEGRTLCGRLRSRCAPRELKILMLSARSGYDDVERGLAAGADAFLTKPVAIGVLTERLSWLLGEART